MEKNSFTKVSTQVNLVSYRYRYRYLKIILLDYQNNCVER